MASHLAIPPPVGHVVPRPCGAMPMGPCEEAPRQHEGPLRGLTQQVALDARLLRWKCGFERYGDFEYFKASCVYFWIYCILLHSTAFYCILLLLVVVDSC